MYLDNKQCLAFWFTIIPFSALQDDINEFDLEERQRFQLYKLVHAQCAADALDMGLISGHTQLSLGSCNWVSVHCEQNVLRKISWNTRMCQFDLQRIDLAWIPSTVTSIDIYYVAQSSCLHTRLLPRESLSIRLMDCHIPGTVDLEALPGKLQFLFLWKNALNGRIVLTKLPPSLRQMDLRENHFHTIVVDNRALPQRLECILISKARLFPQEFIAVDDGEVDQRVSFRVE